MEISKLTDLMNIFRTDTLSTQSVDSGVLLDKSFIENANLTMNFSIQSDSEDEESTLDLTSLVNKHSANSMMEQVLSLQSNSVEVEIQSIEEEKTKKEEEYQTLVNELNKNEENQDINKATQAQNMYQEIQSLNNNL